MRLRFYVAAIVVMVVAAFAVDQLLGKLYVRYMILFSGAIFLWGMLVGQRSEQAWLRRRAGRAPRAPAGLRPVSSNQEVGR
ncbi:MAG: hypothetical protein AB1451_03370 [Nitrospirota bacterium]